MHRVLIAIPSMGTWDADFGMSLAFMMNHVTRYPEIDKKGLMVQLHNKRGSILANSRQSLVQSAIDNGATHILFIDSDQTFPPDLLHRLMKHKKQIVACNIATKVLPSTGTARLKSGTLGVPLCTTPETTDLVRVWRVGTGIMLINTNVFKREGMEKPWFSQYWSEELDAYVGEDWAFCEKLEQSGVSLYVDQEVSREIGHIGKLNYSHDLVTDPVIEEAG